MPAPLRTKERTVFKNEIDRYDTAPGCFRCQNPGSRGGGHSQECRQRLWECLVRDGERGIEWAQRKVDLEYRRQIRLATTSANDPGASRRPVPGGDGDDPDLQREAAPVLPAPPPPGVPEGFHDVPRADERAENIKP